MSGNCPVIDDNNYRNFIDPTVDGDVMHCASRGMWVRDQGYAGTFADSGIPLIPESEWDDRLRQLEKDKADLPTFADEMGLPIRNQRNSNYCWAFGTCRSAEYALLQSGRNIYVSPFSVGGPIKNFRNRGGWGDEALDWMASHGWNTDEEWDADGGASSINRRYYTEENRQKAATRRVTEYYKLSSGRRGWAEVVSAVLAGYGVAAGYNWWGHLICITGLTVGSHNAIIDNSWGANWGDRGRGELSGNRKYPDGAVVITAVTAL